MSTAKVSLLLNSQSSGSNAWFALAEERGYFADEGVDISMPSGKGGYRAAQLLMDDGVDLAFGDLCGIVAASAEHGKAAPVAVYIVHQRSPAAIAVLRDGPVETPADLQGRELIGHGGDVGLRIFAAYGQRAALKPDSVKIRVSTLSMPDMVREALDEGADGVLGYYSSLTAALRQDAPELEPRLRFLRFSEVADELPGSVVMASPTALRERPDTIKAALRAINRGLVDTLADPDAAVAAAIQRNPTLDPVVERARLIDTIAGELEHPEVATLGLGAITPGRLGKAVTLLAESQGLELEPGAVLFSADYLPPLADRLSP